MADEAPSFYPGFDVSRCPNLTAMKWLWENTNLYWIGFYLPVAGKGYEDKKTFIGQYWPLRNMGWGVAPLYVGKQRNSAKLRLKAGKEKFDGYLDGMEATYFARAEMMPPGTVIYFDYEGGDAPTEAWKRYYYGWCEAVLTQLYYPGLYVSHVVAKSALLNDITKNTAAFALGGRPEIWSVNIEVAKKNYTNFIKQPKGEIVTNYPALDPTWSHTPEATSWQYAYWCTIWYLDETNPKKPVKRSITPVDMDASAFRNPGLALMGG